MSIAAIVGLAVLALSACASSKSGAQLHLTTRNCHTPSHYYAVAEIERAFAAHGLKLHKGKKPPTTQGGSVPRAFRTGQVVALADGPGDVLMLVVTRRTPLWLDKLSLNCGGPTPLPGSVLGNVFVSYRANAATAVKAALEQLL